MIKDPIGLAKLISVVPIGKGDFQNGKELFKTL
jgi:hypothetical protein